jgi:septum formation protein
MIKKMTFSVINKSNPLILASASPRRKQLLEQIGMPFIPIPSCIEENEDGNDPMSHTLILSEKKAKAVFQKSKEQWILGADTIVVIDQEIIGKPGNQVEALSMLQRLSGKNHEVITGFCVLNPSGLLAHSEAVSTIVEFRDLQRNEIESYVNTGEPFGKAGSYAIQGIGAFLIKGIQGSYTNVVGLPISALISALQKIGALSSFPF